MVSINQIYESMQSLGTTSSKTSTNEENSDVFKTALSQALEESEETTESNPVDSLGEIESTSAYAQIQNSSSIVSEKTENLLDLLDTYVSQLEDPTVSLKSLSSTIEQINEDASSLLTETQSLDQNNDTDLMDITNQTIAAAQGEYIKFQRGDYL
jgi:hypothetical protein